MQRPFLALAIPNVLTNLTVPLAGLIDIAILGHLDDVTPLAGVALAALIFDFLYWSFAFLRMSATGLVAHAYGAGDHEASAGVFFRSFAMALVIGGVLIAVQTPLSQLGFALLQGDEAVEAAGAAYFGARIWGAPATLGGYVVVGWLLGRSRSKDALVFTATQSVVNIVLDWLFILEWGWGAAGAGYATMVAEVTAFGVGLLMVRRNWAGHPGFSWSYLRSGFTQLVGLQTNILIRTFCLIACFALFTNFSAIYGTVILAGNTILLRILNTAAFFIDGYAFALESLAGKFKGAKDEGGIRSALNVALWWNVGTVAVFVVVFTFAGDAILNGLTKHEPVVQAAKDFFPLVSVALLFSGFAYIYDGLFIGLAKGKLLRNAMLVATLVGFLPLALWAYHRESPTLLWWAMVTYMGLRTLTLGRHTLGRFLG